MRLVRQRTRVPVPEIICYDTSRSIIPQIFLSCLSSRRPVQQAEKQLAGRRAKNDWPRGGRFARQMNEITATILAITRKIKASALYGARRLI